MNQWMSKKILSIPKNIVQMISFSYSGKNCHNFQHGVRWRKLSNNNQTLPPAVSCYREQTGMGAWNKAWLIRECQLTGAWLFWPLSRRVLDGFNGFLNLSSQLFCRSTILIWQHTSRHALSMPYYLPCAFSPGLYPCFLVSGPSLVFYYSNYHT